MTAVLYHFVEYFFPTTVPWQNSTSENARVVRIPKRDIKILEKLPDSYGFRFYDVQMAVENDIPMASARLNVSATHFFDAQIVSPKKAISLFGNIGIVERMKKENWQRAVLCNDGEYRQFKHGDIVVMTKKKQK